MKLLGFNFSKVSAEKNSNDLKDVKINTNINIVDIQEVKTNLLKTKESMVEVTFGYDIIYAPKIAQIEFKGVFVLSMDSKQAKEVLKNWSADKKLDEDFKYVLFNIILRKANIRAYSLEDEMNLPLHLPIPTVQKPAKKE